MEEILPLATPLSYLPHTRVPVPKVPSTRHLILTTPSPSREGRRQPRRPPDTIPTMSPRFCDLRRRLTVITFLRRFLSFVFPVREREPVRIQEITENIRVPFGRSSPRTLYVKRLMSSRLTSTLYYPFIDRLTKYLRFLPS